MMLAGRVMLSSVSKSANISSARTVASVSIRFTIDFGNVPNAATDTLEMETAHSSLAVILYVLVSLAGLVLTCVCEWLVGAAFKLTAVHGKLIIIVNVVSQIVMRVLFVILYSMIPQYWLIMLLLELLVYAGEFVAYRYIAWYMPTRKWLIYVLTANTASLIVGALLNLMIH